MPDACPKDKRPALVRGVLFSGGQSPCRVSDQAAAPTRSLSGPLRTGASDTPRRLFLKQASTEAAASATLADHLQRTRQPGDPVFHKCRGEIGWITLNPSHARASLSLPPWRSSRQLRVVLICRGEKSVPPVTVACDGNHRGAHPKPQSQRSRRKSAENAENPDVKSMLIRSFRSFGYSPRSPRQFSASSAIKPS